MRKEPLLIYEEASKSYKLVEKAHQEVQSSSALAELDEWKKKIRRIDLNSGSEEEINVQMPDIGAPILNTTILT